MLSKIDDTILLVPSVKAQATALSNLLDDLPIRK